jgi:hypothetical protein
MLDQATEKNNDPDLLVHYLTIRKSVGIIGIALPIVLTFGVKWLSNCGTIQNSISDYYYTKMGHYMTGTLCAVALFMFTYKGYEKRDLWAAKLAAIFALGVAFFPMDSSAGLSACKVLALNGNKTVNALHFTSATLLFLTFSYFSFFLFTKTSGFITPRKVQRNFIYKLCGIIILLCIISIALYSFIEPLKIQFRDYKPIFWLEGLALIAFGTSWLIKGEGLLPDKKPEL